MQNNNFDMALLISGAILIGSSVICNGNSFPLFLGLAFLVWGITEHFIKVCREWKKSKK